MVKILTALALATLSQTALGSLCALTNCADVADRLVNRSAETGQPFSLRRVQVISDGFWDMGVQDATGGALIIKEDKIRNLSFVPGDRVDVSGQFFTYPHGETFAHAQQVNVVGRGERPQPRSVTGPEFMSKTNDFLPVRIQGTIEDVFQDEIDPRFKQVLLLCQGELILAPASTNQPALWDAANHLGAEISAVGSCQPRQFGNRIYQGKFFGCSDLTITKEAPTDPFLLPDIKRLKIMPPADIAKAGRHRATGRVLASWHRGSSLLVRVDRYTVLQANLLHPGAPRIGSTVELAGWPFSNTHFLNLTRARWRSVEQPTYDIPTDTAQPVTAKDILTDKENRLKIKPEYHGRTVRMQGIVRSITTDTHNDRNIFIENGSYLIPVDLDACKTTVKELSVGCTVEITGICVLDIENWNPGTAFPLIKGFSLVPRSDEDVVVISRPPWLTRERLMAVVGGLVLLLVGVLVWNRSLRVLANRRGRELYRTQIAKVSSELRVGERTRIAVELHDSLAQNLTGVSMEIEAAKRCRELGLDTVFQHLSIADKALKSCRTDLRNSLWDLRNYALEEKDVNRAIRQTLVPHIKDINLILRFNVPRAKFTDNTLHEILRIIRELTINGIRHGKADEIRIAGAIEGDKLLFSVSDNGCGFDPDDHPGITEGHFGLQGIVERLRLLSGDIAFTSRPGLTKAVVSLPLHRFQKENA